MTTDEMEDVCSGGGNVYFCLEIALAIEPHLSGPTLGCLLAHVGWKEGFLLFLLCGCWSLRLSNSRQLPCSQKRPPSSTC